MHGWGAMADWLEHRTPDQRKLCSPYATSKAHWQTQKGRPITQAWKLIQTKTPSPQQH